MNNIFWFAAGLLTGIVITLVAIPLWRAASGGAGAARWRLAPALLGALAFIGVAIMIYRTIGRPDLVAGRPAMPAAAVASTADTAKQADSLDVSVQRLRARLARDGGSSDDWELLAKSYDFMDEPGQAALARQHQVDTTSRASAAAAGVAVMGTVSIDQSLASRVQPGDTLFIYAKAADSPGPPLALMRAAVGQWPVSFRLDDSMAMLPSHKLSGSGKVVVEARISRTGQAARAPGDLYGVSPPLSPAGGKPLALVISRIIG